MESSLASLKELARKRNIDIGAAIQAKAHHQHHPGEKYGHDKIIQTQQTGSIRRRR